MSVIELREEQEQLLLLALAELAVARPGFDFALRDIAALVDIKLFNEFLELAKERIAHEEKGMARKPYEAPALRKITDPVEIERIEESVKMKPPPEEINVDGYIDDKGIRYIGKALRQPGGKYVCLADVAGCLCRVEVTISSKDPSMATITEVGQLFQVDITAPCGRGNYDGDELILVDENKCQIWGSELLLKRIEGLQVLNLHAGDKVRVTIEVVERKK